MPAGRLNPHWEVMSVTAEWAAPTMPIVSLTRQTQSDSKACTVKSRLSQLSSHPQSALIPCATLHTHAIMGGTVRNFFLFLSFSFFCFFLLAGRREIICILARRSSPHPTPWATEPMVRFRIGVQLMNPAFLFDSLPSQNAGKIIDKAQLTSCISTPFRSSIASVLMFD